MSDDEIKAKVTVGPVSGEVAVKAPGVIETLTSKWAAKARLRDAVVNRAIDRMRSGDFTDADAALVKDLLGEPFAKVERRQAIIARAEKILPAMPVVPQLPSMTGAGNAAEPAKHGVTAEDWMSRFWDDAGLVSDELLQEIYARILASEARAPGSCSLAALKVLRYMDRQTADGFAKVLPLVLNSQVFPRVETFKQQFGIDVGYGTVLELSDAGLIESSHSVSYKPAKEVENVLFEYGNRVLLVKNWHRAEATDLPIFRLTRAGTELARVAQVIRPDDVFFALARWVRQYVGLFADATVTWMEMPADGRIERINKEGKPLPEDAKPEGEKPEPT